MYTSLQLYGCLNIIIIEDYRSNHNPKNPVWVSINATFQKTVQLVKCSGIKSRIHTLSRGTVATESYVSFDLEMIRSAILLISAAERLT